MLAELKFVQGAVAKKDYVPALTHFRIRNRTVSGYNGMIALSSPVDMDVDCAPKAVPFVKAIQTCNDTVELHMTPTGRLAIRSGAFKVFVDCSQEEFPDIQPEGYRVDLKGEMLSVLRKLEPFIAEDASRPWARGILFRGCSAFATNNIIVLEHWLGYNFPVDINVPEEAVKEIIRIGEEPTGLQVGENSLTFHFEGGKWLRTQLLTTEWPQLGAVLDQPNTPSPLPEGVFPALTSLRPFIDDLERVYFLGDKVSTVGTPDDGDGATVEIAGIPNGPIFNLKQFQKLEGLVQTMDLLQSPCIFYGDKIRGAIVGMRA